MPKPKINTTGLDFVQRVERIRRAGQQAKVPSRRPDIDPAEPLGDRLAKMLDLFKSLKTKPSHMIFFVMYDIEDNKVRKQVADYLIAKGCVRVQKSVYMAELPRGEFEQMNQALKEVQEAYENNDSIIFVPISTDELRAMRLIGKNIDFELVANEPSTLFF